MKAPLRFHPFLRPMVWGGRRLGEVLGKPLPNGALYGEAWEVSDHTAHRSIVAGGSWSGWSLRDLLEREPAALLGPGHAGRDRQAPFPWLVKHLDACDWLSVQVHPDDHSVRHLWPGEGGKTEAWFVLDSAPSSRIYAGLLPGTDEKQLRAALAAGTVGDCLHQFQPRPGDCLFLPAGTVHAVGGGVLLAEVQQTSDATFRLFDWNRRDAQGKSRTLHIEEALSCIDWKSGPVQPVRATGYPPAPGQPAATGTVRQALVSCPYFTLEYQRQEEAFSCGGSGTLQVLLVLHGRGTLESADGCLEMTPGDVILLPACLPRLSCQPRTPLGLLVATLPSATR